MKASKQKISPKINSFPTCLPWNVMRSFTEIEIHCLEERNTLPWKLPPSNGTTGSGLSSLGKLSHWSSTTRLSFSPWYRHMYYYPLLTIHSISISCLGSWGPSTNFIKICNRLLIMPSVSFKLHQMFFILVNTFSKKDNHHLHHHLCLTATISTIITSSKRGLKKVVKFGVRRPCLFLRQHRPWMKTFFWNTNLNGSIIQEHNLVLIYQERKKEIYLSIHIMFFKLVLALYIAQSGRLSEYKWLSVAEKSAPWSFLPRGGNNVTTVVGISFFVFRYQY